MRVDFGLGEAPCRQYDRREFSQKLARGMVRWNFEFSGTPADWVVHDLRVDGMTRFRQDGDIPGDMFAMKPAMCSFVAFTKIPAGASVLIAVQFIGDAPEAPFACALIGHAEAKGDQ